MGWSTYSPTLNVLVATVPSRPEPVDLISASETSISLQFYESLDNGGSEILGYELWIDDGYGTDFSQVASYTDNSITHTITAGLVSGQIYTFKYKSFNSVGYSAFSIEKRYAVTLPPSKPIAPSKDMSKSTLTSIYVKWSESPPTQVPITGYKLYMSQGTSEYSEIYTDL